MILAQFMSEMSLRQQIGRKFQDSVFLLNKGLCGTGVIRRVGMYPPYPNVRETLARLQKQFDQEDRGFARRFL